MTKVHCAWAALLCTVSFAQSSNGDANQFVRLVLGHELQAEIHDQSHWSFRLQTYKPGGAKETDEVIETKDGDLKRPLLINGHPISKAEADKRLEHLARDSNALQKSLKEKQEDTARSQKLLKMLPDAFTFKFGARRGDLVQLKFSPNPAFKPPNREAEVFHAMEGSIWLDRRQSRLEEISGHLIHEVKFGGGVLGHLDPGGTFDLERSHDREGAVLQEHCRAAGILAQQIQAGARRPHSCAGNQKLRGAAHSRGQQTNSLNTGHDPHPRLRQSYKRARSELMHEKRATSLLVTRNQI